MIRNYKILSFSFFLKHQIFRVRKYKFFNIIQKTFYKLPHYYKIYYYVFLDLIDAYICGWLLLIIIKCFFLTNLSIFFNISLLILGTILSYKFNLLDKVKVIYASFLKKTLPHGITLLSQKNKMGFI